MSRRAAKENSWLFKSNLPLSMVQELEKLDQHNKECLVPNNVPILPFDEDKIIRHMRNRIAGLGKEIIVKGVDGLKTAAKNGQLLPGYLIFEEVPLSGVWLRGKPMQMYGPLGWLYDTLCPLLCQYYCGQSRSFIYFHAFIYAGEYGGEHYVIENGGEESPDLHQGQELRTSVTVCPLELASIKKHFTKKNFFIVEPPKDEFGLTTRHMVLQRALATIGMKYQYHLVIGCEAFCTLIVGLFEDWHPLQLRPNVLALKTKTFASEEHKKAAERRVADRYQELRKAVLDRLQLAQPGMLLTLPYILKNCINYFISE